MIRDISIGRYFPAKSFVHAMDARAKLLLTLAMIVVTFLCKNLYSLAALCVFTILIYLSSRLKPLLILKSLKPLLPLLILTVIMQVIFTKTGTPVLTVGKFSVYDDALIMSLFVCVRILVLIVVSSLLTYTTSPTRLTDAIERLLSPLKHLKIDVGTFAMMMTIALRFIPTLIDEIDRLTSAQKARGADFESGNLIQRVKSLFPIFIPLFVSAIQRASELADAMICRCYTGEGRTSYRVMKFGWRDAVALLAVAVFTGGVITLNVLFAPLL
ncbi:MAG: energy-coupling factor transporter transmembrane protein EcfT [Clostridia bacterium]|nr:energy-coupling factor transporter transmembrane protein EcfT [Clostridia bacterium]